MLCVLALTLFAVAARCMSVRSSPNLLELSARPWLYELKQRYGRTILLDTVPDEILDEIRSKNIDEIYLLGVWALGNYGLNFDRTDSGLISSYHTILPDFTNDDVIGSCFAVTSYECNRDVCSNGSTSVLQTFRERLHKRGMRLILDFVPNHSAVDSKDMAANRNLFVRGTQGRDDVIPGTDVYYGRDYSYFWKDTAQYNYWNPDTIKRRLEDLMAVAAVSDGCRCDMAMLALNKVFGDIWSATVTPQGYKQPANEFWTYAIGEVKKRYPDFTFMAEVYWGYGEELLSRGFDFVYDKDGLYDLLSSNNLTNLREYIQKDSNIYKKTHFIENHDEGRAVAHFGVNYKSNSAALVTFLLPGMRFHFMGQWEGKRNKLDVHLRRSYNEPVDTVVSSLYDKLLPLMGDEIFHTGKWRLHNVTGTSSSWRLMAWSYELNGKFVLVVVNYTEQEEGQGRVVIPRAPSGTVDLWERLSNQHFQRSGSEMKNAGLYVIVDKNWAQIFYF